MTMAQLTGWIDDGASIFYGRIGWNERGLVTELTPFGGVKEPPSDAAVIRAGLFNAHSHPEQSIYADIVDKEWDLGTWCRRTIYRYSTAMTPRRVRLACERAFVRMMAFGTTSVMASYYLHGNRGNELDREVLAAARSVGIRLIFGRMNYDVVSEDASAGKKASQRSYYETPENAEQYLRELTALEDETLMICPALHSMHASTEAAIARGIALGWELRRPVQFHLSEDRGDVELSLKRHGCRPMAFLQRLLDEGRVPSLSHVILSDCCWLDDEERRLIARNGMKVVLNARMNARVKTGFPDVPALLASRIPLWCGTDGEASNDDLNVQGEREFLKARYRGVIDPKTIERFGRQRFDCGAGYIGALGVGGWADLQVVKNGAVRDVYVGGRRAMENGRLLGLDVERDVERPLREEVAAMTAEPAVPEA